MLVAIADFIGGVALSVDKNGLRNHTYQFLGVGRTHAGLETETLVA